MPGILVTATDTGVGKTTVASALVRRLRARGAGVAVLKPFESGCARGEGGTLFPADAALLRAAAGDAQPLAEVCPNRFEAPIAPGIAQVREGRAVHLEGALAAARDLESTHDWVVVEGAGGLLVPLTPTEDVADLAVRLGFPLLVVARAGLGTLNHTRLTVAVARARGLEVAAIVLNAGPGAVDPEADPSITDNPAVLRRTTGLPVVGPLPHRPGDAPDLASDIDPLLAALGW